MRLHRITRRKSPAETTARNRKEDGVDVTTAEKCDAVSVSCLAALHVDSLRSHYTEDEPQLGMVIGFGSDFTQSRVSPDSRAPEKSKEAVKLASLG